jgi:hypothetical protein
MAYLGNAPARSFISFERQVFTIVNSQTAYTLSHSVNNENDIRLVINNIVQEPGSGKAYTASGTTLTLSAALTNGTDEMYCVFLGRAVATNSPGAGSVNTAAIAADAVTEAKIADSAVENEHLNVNVITGQTAETSIATDDTILIHDTSASALRKMTRANFVSGIGGTNTPNFWVYLNSNQSVATTTFTTVAFTNELFDTANAFDTSTHKYTAPSAGKWFFGINVRKENSRTDRNLVHFKVNNSTKSDFETGSYSNYGVCVGTTVVDLNANDVVHLEFYHDRGSNQSIRSGLESTFFYGFKLIT